MRRRRRKSQTRAEPARVIRLWTYDRAGKALPYIRSIAGSLRDHWLDVQATNSKLLRLGKEPGPNRKESILKREDAESEHGRAKERFVEALEELTDMDVFLLDPIRGVALIPFNKANNLAWFVFDMFDENGLKSWRFHEDPMETRRPIDEAIADPLANPAASGSNPS